ncbi:alpha-ketoglutarate-dependent sulfonate dioxygenase [Setomelanomma holmii]|uniref:Alpha-ketoglutarate-dependent sulfonate dioxygenase n=1 Tax=Setomelanomma holmii TaxID=210430 RepID=A0A9P4LSG1_9PLEO|nr:alpha-ketoglutarate-dependent sulfonate dioxygenase [Setomelanomma holmii]
MATLESRNHILPDSGYPITLHSHFNTKIVAHIPPEPPHAERTPAPDRGLLADPDKRALLTAATRTDLTESIGTLTQLDDLALLVSERRVVFFRDQDLTTEQQVKLFEHYGELDKHPAQKGQRHVNIGASNDDFREILNYTPWPQGDWHADTSFEINPPSYSLLRMEEAPDVGGDTQWVSQYGLYEALSPHLRAFLENDTILDLWGVGPNRAPVDTHHPAVITHPVTELKALNVTNNFVTGFAELKKKESGMDAHGLAADHQGRWKWEKGSVAIWDNRATAHRAIPGKYTQTRRGIRTTVFGTKLVFNPTSGSRDERAVRLKTEASISKHRRVDSTQNRQKEQEDASIVPA